MKFFYVFYLREEVILEKVNGANKDFLGENGHNSQVYSQVYKTKEQAEKDLSLYSAENRLRAIESESTNIAHIVNNLKKELCK